MYLTYKKGNVMNVLVTGGAGFIGSRLVLDLVARGYDVTVVDNMSRGRFKNLPRTYFDSRHTDRPRVYRCDVQDIRSLEGRWPIIFHLAAEVTNIAENRRNHLYMMQANLQINTAMTELIRHDALNIRRYIYVSTACVYPHDASVPTPERAAKTCSPEPTNYGYGVAKWVGERQAYYLHREYDVPTTVVRFFNAFGERDYYDWKSSHVAPALIRKCMERDEIVVWGSGDQTRSLVDVRDISKALILLLQSNRYAASDGRPINIGHRREISMIELARLIRVTCNRPEVEITTDPTKPNGYMRRAADPSLLRALIGWIPDTPIEETIERMVRDYKRQKKEGLIND